MIHSRGTNLKLGQDMALLHTCAVDAGDAEDHVDSGAGLHEGPALEVVAVLLLAGVVAWPQTYDLTAVLVMRRLIRLEVFDGPWQTHQQHGIGTGTKYRDGHSGQKHKKKGDLNCACLPHKVRVYANVTNNNHTHKLIGEVGVGGVGGGGRGVIRSIYMAVKNTISLKRVIQLVEF